LSKPRAIQGLAGQANCWEKRELSRFFMAASGKKTFSRGRFSGMKEKHLNFLSWMAVGIFIALVVLITEAAGQFAFEQS
jgi:hypothetical protein